jgi:tetratricopeptide (TPR) repeat protein
MRKYFMIAFAATTLLTADVSAQVTMPAPSPTSMIRQDFGMGRMELTYSRPSIRGRQLFGENTVLAPLGKQWRTGANAATQIRFTDKVTVGGKMLDSGRYVIYTVPGKGQWDVVFSKGTAYPAQEGFKESDDVVRLKAPVTSLKDKVETFTMQFANIRNESCDLQLMWGNTAVSFPITTNIKDRLRKQIETALQGQNKPYQQAATFYYEWDKNYTKALEYINKGIEANPKAYFLYLIKARIQKDAGDKAGAIATANKTIELATEGQNDDYVRMAKELIATK